MLFFPVKCEKNNFNNCYMNINNLLPHYLFLLLVVLNYILERRHLLGICVVDFSAGFSVQQYINAVTMFQDLKVNIIYDDLHLTIKYIFVHFRFAKRPQRFFPFRSLYLSQSWMCPICRSLYCTHSEVPRELRCRWNVNI